MASRVIGKSVPRKEGREKVTGRQSMWTTIRFPGMIHGVTVRSSVARANSGIRFWPE